MNTYMNIAAIPTQEQQQQRNAALSFLTSRLKVSNQSKNLVTSATKLIDQISDYNAKCSISSLDLLELDIKNLAEISAKLDDEYKITKSQIEALIDHVFTNDQHKQDFFESIGHLFKNGVLAHHS